MNALTDVAVEVALVTSKPSRRDHYKALLEARKSVFKDCSEGVHVAKPKISDVVAYMEHKGMLQKHTKPRPDGTYRSSKRNTAKAMRKYLGSV